MTKTQVYLSEEQIALLHRLAKRDRKSVAAIIRDAIGATLEKALPANAKQGQGPVALWTGEIKRTSMDHDSVYDGP